MILDLQEKQIQKQIEDYLRKSGWFVIPEPHVPRKPKYNFVGTKGRSDTLTIRSGEFAAIEIKRPGGKPTPEQEAFLANVRGQGFIAFVAYGLEDVISRLGRRA